MSTIILRDGIDTILLPSSVNEVKDAVDGLLDRIKGGIALAIGQDDSWMVLIQDGGKFDWIDVTDCIPAGEAKGYYPDTVKKLTTVTSVRKPPDTPEEPHS